MSDNENPSLGIAQREQLAAEAGYAKQDADRLLKQHDRAKEILGEALGLSPDQTRACRIEELAGIAAGRIKASGGGSEEDPFEN